MSGIPLRIETTVERSTDPSGERSVDASASGYSAPDPIELDWAALTRGIVVGDQDSFPAFYDFFFDDIYRQVRWLSGRPEADSLDLVQEVFMKLIRCMKPIDNRPALTAWIRCVTRSVVYDWLRRECRRFPVETLADPVCDQKANHAHPWIENQARLIWIEEQLQQLPAGTRRMIAFRYRMGWTLKQIGERLGMKTGAVDGKIRRALEKIKAQAVLEFEDIQ